MEADKEILIAFKKAQTHLGNVIGMLESKEYCIDIIQQNLAVIGLLKSANSKLFKRHINSCFLNVMKGTNQKRKDQILEEIIKINKIAQ